MSPQSSPTTNVFDAAKAIVESLKGLDKERQELAIHFASVSLGLSATVPGRSSSSVQSPLSSTSPTQTTTEVHSHRTMDIRSFVEEKSPKSDVQYAAVIAYYYRFEAPEEERRESISAKILQESTRHANRKRLSNPGKTLNNATALGYLDRTGRGEFRISTVGENLVAMTLPGGNDSASGSRRNRQGRKKSSSKRKVKKKTSRKAR